MRNYDAWNIEPQSFDPGWNNNEKLKFLLGFAILAPSPYNSQPWQFQITSKPKDTIQIFIDFTRFLNVSDVNMRHLIMSLGCVVENILIAGDYYGMTFDLIIDHEFSPKGAVIELELVGESDFLVPMESHLIISIPKRSTSRAPYQGDAAIDRLMRDIGQIRVPGLRVDFLSDPVEKKKLADLILDANVLVFEDPAYRNELADYVLPTSSSKSVGMPGFGWGIPDLLSHLTATVIKLFNIAKFKRDKDEDLLINHTPIFGIISTREDNRSDWLEVGRMFENTALRAEQKGLKMNICSSVLEVGENAAIIRTWLNINEQPQLVFRLGKPMEDWGHTPRLLVAEVLRNVGSL